jgi:hypothetical protein
MILMNKSFAPVSTQVQLIIDIAKMHFVLGSHGAKQASAESSSQYADKATACDSWWFSINQ